MKNERKRILEMVKKGEVSIEEAEKLLDELEELESRQKEKQASIDHRLPVFEQWESKDGGNKKGGTSGRRKTLKDTLFGLFEDALDKIKDFEFDSQHSVAVSHVYQQNDSSFNGILIEIPNGSVTLHAWDYTDVRIELDGKVYRTEDPVEGKEKFLNNIEFKIDDGKFSFSSKEKFMKTDAKIYVPEKKYEKIDIKLFNGPVTAEGIKAEKMDVKTANGQIRLIRTECGKAEAETGNGSIQITESQCKKLEAETLNGKVTVDGQYEKTEIQTFSGTITVYLDGGDAKTIRLSSGTGNIFVYADRKLPLSGEMKSNLGTVQLNLDHVRKVEETKEALQKTIYFDTSDELKGKTYLFAGSKTGMITVKNK